MVTSNEPGIYREGRHGIRRENIVACRESGANEFGDWHGFETLTCCHIDTAAVLPDLLDSQEKAWLNSYNEKVYRRLSRLLSPEESAWLRAKTQPVH
jgi:Xaa-Pro aminopeptidase